MGTTAKYGWPYPELTDPPDGPAQLKALAEGIENTLYPRSSLLAFTRQVSRPPMNQTGANIDFTAAEWPRPVFTVPASGSFLLTTGCDLQNLNSATSTVYLRWRANPGTIESFNGDDIINASGCRIIAGKMCRGSGFTPGQSLTLVPLWYISSGNATTAYIQGGFVFVQMID